MTDLVTAFGVIAIVLVVSALAAGLIERAPVSFPMIFLGIGILLGERGLGLIQIDAHDPALEAVAILSLALVLFLDAVKLRLDEIGHDWHVPLLALGPGTLLIIGLIALSAALLLGLPPVAALLLGAILSSTDPVVLRDVVRDGRIPRAVRRALSIESGMNDIVVLPIILVLIAVARARLGDAVEWLRFLGQLFLLGPAVWFTIGGVGSWLVEKVDARHPIRREYQALYGVGLVLAAYVAGVAVGGDGFLAAFTAGVAVSVLNNELCDCFLDYGEITAEMTMLLAFILFGALLGTIPLGPVFILGAIVIGLARPLAMLLVLVRARMSFGARAFIAWFGPRGLNSLLFALLLVQAELPGAEYLLAIVGVVVIMSVVAHGATAVPLVALYARHLAKQTESEERESTAAGLFRASPSEVPRIMPADLARRLAEPDPPLVLDVRTRSSFERDPARLPGSIRVLPDQIAEWATGQPAPRAVVTYCT